MAAKKNSKKTKKAASKKKTASKKTKTAKKDKAPKKTTKKAAPTTGQSAPPIELGFEDLNAHEQKVVILLNGAGKGKRESLSLSDISINAGFKKSVGVERGYIRAKNATRRLIRSKWIEHAEEKGKGTYRITAAGRKRLARVDTSKTKKAAPKTKKKGGGKKTIKKSKTTKKTTGKKHATANPNAVAPLPSPTMVTPPIH